MEPPLFSILSRLAQPSLQTHFFLLSGAELPSAEQDCRLYDSYPSHTEYITQQPTAAQTSNISLEVFFPIRKMLKLYLFWIERECY